MTIRGIHASQDLVCLSVYSCLIQSLGAVQGKHDLTANRGEISQLGLITFTAGRGL